YPAPRPRPAGIRTSPSRSAPPDSRSASRSAASVSPPALSNAARSLPRAATRQPAPSIVARNAAACRTPPDIEERSPPDGDAQGVAGGLRPNAGGTRGALWSPGEHHSLLGGGPQLAERPSGRF